MRRDARRRRDRRAGRAHEPHPDENSMTPFLRRTLAAFALLLVCIVPAALAAERSQVESKYTWDLTALYPSDAAWSAAKADLAARIPTLEKHKGTLGKSAADLLAGLQDYVDIGLALDRLGSYAGQHADEDTRVSAAAEMRDGAQQLGVALGAATAYMRPEIIALGPVKVRALIASEPRLEPYRFYLEDLVRYAPHTRSAAEEELIARSGRMAYAGGSIRNTFNNADMKWPTVTLSDGKQVRLDDAAYTQYRQVPLKADRDTVFHAYFLAHRDFQATYGAALNAGVQSHVFAKDAANFGTSLESALFGDNIPVSVYRQLVEDVNKNLPTLHRYLKLRQKMMGLPKLGYEDLYPSVVKNVDLKYTPEQAAEMVLAATAPLGKAYVDTLGMGLRSRWVDWMPNTGKRSGAYSTIAYGVHPYQLLNFTGKYDGVTTLAHESGHSMHSFLATHRQPYITAGYATFVAEVASTFNENLLLHYMLDHTTDRDTRLFLLGNALETLRGTLFRQTMFAEFELAIHEKVEKGETLSGEGMSRIYLDLVRKYYGHDSGVCSVDPLYGVEWSCVPHFYRNFYVYQYATSIVASTALAKGVREEAALKKGTPKRDAYLNMLAAGGSKFPIDLLREAGVDMTTPAPFEAAMKEMNAIMDEMEKLQAAK
jgi:oligoendopeptidase F